MSGVSRGISDWLFQGKLLLNILFCIISLLVESVGTFIRVVLV